MAALVFLRCVEMLIRSGVGFSQVGCVVTEIFIQLSDGTKKAKSISRSTVELGYRRAREAGGIVKGPKALGLPGAPQATMTVTMPWAMLWSCQWRSFSQRDS